VPAGSSCFGREGRETASVRKGEQAVSRWKSAFGVRVGEETVVRKELKTPGF
jgi:hypothetical protein